MRSTSEELGRPTKAPFLCVMGATTEKRAIWPYARGPLLLFEKRLKTANP